MFGRGRQAAEESVEQSKNAREAARQASGKSVSPGSLLEGVYTAEQIGRSYKVLGTVSVRLTTANSPASFDEAARALLAAAREYGADAVVAVRYDSAVEQPKMNWLWVTVHAYGTAVRFEG